VKKNTDRAPFRPKTRGRFLISGKAQAATCKRERATDGGAPGKTYPQLGGIVVDYTLENSTFTGEIKGWKRKIESGRENLFRAGRDSYKVLTNLSMPSRREKLYPR